MSEVVVLQHAACESLGTIENALRRAGLSHRYVRTQNEDPVPHEIGDAAGLIVMGGSMGAYEEERYPFLTEEKRLIAQALSQGLPILGVCLGAQLLASVLDAPVRPGARKEIGWHPVRLTLEAAGDALWQGVPSSFTGFHWHGDFFERPPGAVSLASSALTPCQAFRFRQNVYGFQFHLEVTDAIICDWTAEFAGELAAVEGTPAAITGGMAQHLLRMQGIAQEVFGRWAALAATHGREASVASK